MSYVPDVANVLSEDNISQIEWTAYSPDINLTENIWYILQNMVFKLHSKSTHKLKYSM